MDLLFETNQRIQKVRILKRYELTKMNLNPDTLSEIKSAFSSALSEKDKEKYASIGSQFYNMMNFENLEEPIDTKSLLYTMNIVAKTNKIMEQHAPTAPQ